MVTRRSFLKVSGAVVGAGVLDLCGASASPKCSFFVIGDTHFLADREMPERMDETSALYTEGLVRTLNGLKGSRIPELSGGGVVANVSGVLHAGDVVDSADKGGPIHLEMQRTEWARYERLFGMTGAEGLLRMPVMEIGGNHDGPHGTGHVIASLAARQRSRKGLTGLSQNGLHYSWEWGGVHFIALGLIVGSDVSVLRKRRYAASESLDFLREDLAKNVSSGQPVVILHHVDVARYSDFKPDTDFTKWEWDPADVKAYYETIRSHRVVVFYGHTHRREVFRWDGTGGRPSAGVPVFNVDNSSHFGDARQAFFYVEIAEGAVRVREFATGDGWITGAWSPQHWQMTLG
jgi:hypothetical protein